MTPGFFGVRPDEDCALGIGLRDDYLLRGLGFACLLPLLLNVQLDLVNRGHAYLSKAGTLVLRG